MNQRKTVLEYLENMARARNENEYNLNYNKFISHLAVDASFKTYFDNNWHSNKEDWLLFHRGEILTRGSNTNNRIERFNRSIKDYLQATDHLIESIRKLIAYTKQDFNTYIIRNTANVNKRVVVSDKDSLFVQTFANQLNDHAIKILRTDGHMKAIIKYTDNQRCKMETQNDGSITFKHISNDPDLPTYIVKKMKNPNCTAIV